MKQTNRKIVAGACGIVLALTVCIPVHAAFLIEGGSSQGLPIAHNRFNSELTGLGFDQMTSGAQLKVSQDGFVDFSYIGAESGFENSFAAQGTALSGNNRGFLTEHNEGFDFSGYAGFTIAVSANDILNFSFTSDDETALTPVDNLANRNLQGLGIYFDSSHPGSLQQVLLGYDDQTINDDNDFEDMLIRADFRPAGSAIGAGQAVVPLPATVWLFAGGLAGLAGLGRRFSSRS